MTVYRELHLGYSTLTDCEMVRISATDKHHREFYALVPRDQGRRWRERRDEALENIEAAISQGCEPGEVRISE